MRKTFVRLFLPAMCAALFSCGDAYDDSNSTGQNQTSQQQETSSTADSTPAATQGDAGSATPTLGNVVQPILTANCSCHLSASPPAGMSLAEGKSFAAIVGVQSAVGSCTSLKRIEPGKPNDSALVKRIEGNTCGTQMPRGGPPLSADKVSTIRKWVEAGAANN